jgi:hypothetical protein
MSEYEGKTYWRRRSEVTLSELLYYECTGEVPTPKIRKKLLEIENTLDTSLMNQEKKG